MIVSTKHWFETPTRARKAAFRNGPRPNRRFGYRVKESVMVLVIVAITALPSFPNASAASTVTGTVVLNMATNRLDGVLLISEVPQRHFGAAEKVVIPALEAHLGKAQIFSSTICRLKIPVTVASWHDLSIAFQNGRFALLAYNYGGWSVAFEKVEPLPPVGRRLTPLFKTNLGIDVGDSAARVKSLDPLIRGSALTSFFVGTYTVLATTMRTGAKGGPDEIYHVSQIQVATGNC